MTQTVKRSLIIVSGLLALSCGSASDEGEAPGHTEEGDHAVDASASDHGLSLNGDVKWPMDAHTRTMFAKMTASFGEGEFAGDASSIMDTGTKLRGEINELIQGCTMTGEAHDQLHTYLMAYIPAVDRMATVGTKAQADSVGMLLDLYPMYFE